MSNRTLDRMLAAQHAREEACCADCGYYRRGAHHPNIRCPKTGRCGDCGNDWPCADHAKWRVFMVYGSFEDPVSKVNFIVMRVPEGHLAWSRKIVPAIYRLVRPWRGLGVSDRYFWHVDSDPNPKQSLWDTKKARRYQWDGTNFVEVPR